MNITDMDHPGKSEVAPAEGFGALRTLPGAGTLRGHEVLHLKAEPLCSLLIMTLFSPAADFFLGEGDESDGDSSGASLIRTGRGLERGQQRMRGAGTARGWGTRMYEMDVA